MILSLIDEINAYRNEDGSWTIEGYSDKNTFKIPHASIDLSLQGRIGIPVEMEITLRGEVEKC